jgi:hypothetical protein
VLVLVAINVSKFPCQTAVCKFPSDLVNNIMMGLFRSVLNVFKDCDKARLTVTTDFDGGFVDVVECGNGFCDNNNCKHAAKFTAVWIDNAGVSWGTMCSKDAGGFIMPVLQDKGSGDKMIFVRAVTYCYGVHSYDGLGNSTTVLRAMESADCPFIVVVDYILNAQDGTDSIRRDCTAMAPDKVAVFPGSSAFGIEGHGTCGCGRVICWRA